MKTTNKRVLLQPTKENVKKTVELIKIFADSKGYTIEGTFKEDSVGFKLLGLIKSELTFEHKSHSKKLSKLMEILERKISLKRSNNFLQFLYGTIYKTVVPEMKISAKEQAIQNAKKHWKELRDQAEIARLKYKEEKGNFYKK